MGLKQDEVAIVVLFTIVWVLGLVARLIGLTAIWLWTLGRVLPWPAFVATIVLIHLLV